MQEPDPGTSPEIRKPKGLQPSRRPFHRSDRRGENLPPPVAAVITELVSGRNGGNGQAVLRPKTASVATLPRYFEPLVPLNLSSSHPALRVARSWSSSSSEPNSWNIIWRPELANLLLNENDLSSDDQSDPSICATCRTLNIEVVYRLDSSKLPNEGVELCAFTGLSRDMLQSDCSICRAFASFLPSTFGTGADKKSISGKLFALPASSLSGMREALRAVPVSTILGISLEANPIRWDAVARCTSELQGLLLPTLDKDSDPRGLCHGKALEKFADFARVREMLSRCAKEHKTCQNPTEQFPVLARVIDCKSRKMVPLEENFRYLALSYVWGVKSSSHIDRINEEAKGDTLPSRLPTTIEDAITATQRLGLRYLWCDRYCIEQFHSADKAHQISQMSRIFNRALGVICALGARDDVGLPGVSLEREPFPTFKIHGLPFVACPAPILLQQRILRSVWSTRGWTFQEALLARRCLFFTDEQVIVACQCSTQHESIVQRVPTRGKFSDNVTVSNGQMFSGSTATIFSTILEPELRWLKGIHGQLKLSDYVQHYLRRSFTVDTDALSAFKGILSTIDNQSYYGIVVVECPSPRMDPDTFSQFLRRLGFAHGLLWVVDGYTNLRGHTNLMDSARTADQQSPPGAG